MQEKAELGNLQILIEEDVTPMMKSSKLRPHYALINDSPKSLASRKDSKFKQYLEDQIKMDDAAVKKPKKHVAIKQQQPASILD